VLLRRLQELCDNHHDVDDHTNIDEINTIYGHHTFTDIIDVVCQQQFIVINYNNY